MSQYNWKRTIENPKTFRALILYVNHFPPLCYKHTVLCQQNDQKVKSERSYLTVLVMKSVKARSYNVCDRFPRERLIRMSDQLGNIISYVECTLASAYNRSIAVNKSELSRKGIIRLQSKTVFYLSELSEIINTYNENFRRAHFSRHLCYGSSASRIP